MLANSNSYAGVTTVTGGTLQFGGGGAVSLPPTPAYAINGSLVFDSSSNLTIAAPISATGSLLLAGGGILTLTGSNTYSGGSIVNGGTLQVASVAALGGGGAVSLGNGGLLQVLASAAAGTTPTGLALAGSGAVEIDSAATVTVAGAVTGSGGPLTKTGGGALALQNAAANSYSAGTVVNAGKLIVYGGGALGTGPVTLNNGAALTLCTTSSAISGFGGNGTGWTLNGGATVTNNVLAATTAAGNEARSAFLNVPIAGLSGGFAASFVYMDVAGGSGNNADGVTFTLQGSGTPAAVGSLGAGLGYQGIAHSGGVVLNVYAAAPGGIGTQFCYASSAGTNNPANAGGAANLSVAPVNLAGGDPIQVNLLYNAAAQTLTEVLTDSSSTSTTTFSNVNFAALLGSNSTSAYVGFTGGTGGQDAIQTISNFNLTASASVVNSPVSLSNSVVLPAQAAANLNVTPGSASSSAGIGTLVMGTSATLNVAADGGAGGGFTLAAGSVGVSRAAAFNVAGGTLSLGPINDGGSAATITLAGSGVTIFSASNRYTGATTLSAGTLVLALPVRWPARATSPSPAAPSSSPPPIPPTSPRGSRTARPPSRSIAPAWASSSAARSTLRIRAG